MDKEDQRSLSKPKKEWTNEDLSPFIEESLLSIVGGKFDYVRMEIDEWRRIVDEELND